MEIVCLPRRRVGSRSRRKAVGRLACLNGGQWREDSIGKSNIENMKAVIFIERVGNSWTHQWMYEGHCHKERRKVKAFPIPWSMVYGLSDLRYIVPRLTDTRE